MKTKSCSVLYLEVKEENKPAAVLYEVILKVVSMFFPVQGTNLVALS